MLDDFFIRATLAGIGVAIASAPLGCFVVWRRMAYFGDATAHAAILGVALSLALSMNIFIGVVAISMLVALTVSTLTTRGYAIDTLLGVIAHSALAFGLVAVSFLQGVRIDLMAYLFGDILAVGIADLIIIWLGATFVIALLIWRWSALLTATLNPDLAYASNIDPKREQLILTLALAIVVAVALKIIGALLISAMLIIPAATARIYGRSPEGMAIIATLIGVVSALGGLQASYHLDTPTGPTIVCVAALLFIISNLISVLKKTS
jgi:zinc transport system permease protein